ncbi:MAG: phage tail protein [Coxiellaceae bacterium]|nr:phage tail protein [Coxiellaceae bacterium]
MLMKGLVTFLLSFGLVASAHASFVLIDSGALPAISFSEADGLQSQTSSIIERHSNSSTFYPIKMPGIGRVGNITLRQGVVMNNDQFWNFYNEVEMNTIARTTMVLHGPRGVTFTLHNAWPVRITGTNLKKKGEQVTLESIEIAYEQLTISYDGGND